MVETFSSASDNVGVILFHVLSRDYSKLRGLANRLKRDNLRVFEVSYGARCRELFPRSMAILVTESSMVLSPTSTVSFLEWFSRAVKRKPGSGWKLMCRPNVKAFLRDVAIASEGLKRKHFLDMLVHIQNLSPSKSSHTERQDEQSSCCESLSGEDEDDNAPNYIISPHRLVGYGTREVTDVEEELARRDTRLIDFFAGWACERAHVFRRFDCISPTTKGKEYAHIETMTAEKFIRLATASRFEKPPVAGKDQA